MAKDSNSKSKHLAIDAPKQALIDAGLKLFGRHGFDGVSIRQICAEADTNIASVSYHFNGKDDLYEACVLYISAQMRQYMRTEVSQVRAFLSSGADDPDQAKGLILSVLSRMIDFFVPDSKTVAEWAPFAIRARLDKSGMFAPQLGDSGSAMLAELIGVACSSPKQTRRNISMAHALMGQIQIYRINRTSILLSLGLKKIGPKDLKEIRAVLLANASAALDAQRSQNS